MNQLLISYPVCTFIDFFKEIYEEESYSEDSKVSSSFGSEDSKSLYSAANSKSNSKNTRFLTAIMRLERFYSSVREEISPLSEDGATLLASQDYVGFFKACGPNYLRGIRRAQELFATFIFTSTSDEKASQFISKMKTSKWTSTSSSNFKQEESELEIHIQGFGLGLRQDGSDALMATTLEQYRKAIEFGYKAMTTVGKNHQIGMVYGFEIAPWVYNTEFQVAAGLLDVVIEVPVTRSLIPKVSDGGTCSSTVLIKDKNDNCCEQESLYKDGAYVGPDYSGDGTDAVCKPVRTLDPNIIRDNMVNNGEFVARLDSTLRYKMTALSTLENCISAANTISDNFKYNKLKSKDSAGYDRLTDSRVSLAELKLSLDPKKDFRVVKQLSREIFEWMEMYYEPCLAAIFGANVGFTPQSDVNFFMAYPWYSHDECMKLTCLSPSLRWDRATGTKCVSGVLHGTAAVEYTSSETFCAKDVDQFGDTEVCKYDQSAMSECQTTEIKDTCWKDLETTSLERLMTHFCNPVVTYDVVDEDTENKMDTAWNSCRP